MQKASTSTTGEKSMETVYTPITKENLSHIIMLAHRIWPVSYAGILTPEQIDNMLTRIYTHENLQSEMQQGHEFWVAYNDIKPVGYASVFKDDDSIWVKKLYVEPSVQGKGIGVRLLHSAVSALLPAVDIRLLANPNNIPAHNFYAHLGFKKIGEVPVQMGDWHFNDFMFSMPLTDEE